LDFELFAAAELTGRSLQIRSGKAKAAPSLRWDDKFFGRASATMPRAAVTEKKTDS
jgi:hypothetical protein